MGFTKQALYCYNKAYSLDPTNVDALWDRAILAKEIGQMNTVRAAQPAYSVSFIQWMPGKDRAQCDSKADPA